MYRKFLSANMPTIPQKSVSPRSAPVAPPVPKSPKPTKPEPVARTGAKQATGERTNTVRPYKLTLQISTGALAVGGFVGGLIFNGMVDSEYENYEAVRDFRIAEETRTNTEKYMATRDLFYILGAIGLSGFAVTLFF